MKNCCKCGHSQEQHRLHHEAGFPCAVKGCDCLWFEPGETVAASSTGDSLNPLAAAERLLRWFHEDENSPLGDWLTEGQQNEIVYDVRCVATEMIRSHIRSQQG